MTERDQFRGNVLSENKKCFELLGGVADAGVEADNRFGHEHLNKVCQLSGQLSEIISPLLFHSSPVLFRLYARHAVSALFSPGQNQTAKP